MKELAEVQSDDEASSESSEDFGSSSEEEQISLQKLHPTIPKTYMEKNDWARLIIILEAANLETTKTGRGIELINCDDH